MRRSASHRLAHKLAALVGLDRRRQPQQVGDRALVALVDGRHHLRLGGDRVGRALLAARRVVDERLLELVQLARLGEVPHDDLPRREAAHHQVGVRRAEAEAEDVARRLEHELRVDRVGEGPEQHVARLHLARHQHALVEGEPLRARDRDGPLDVGLPVEEAQHPVGAVLQVVERLQLAQLRVGRVAQARVLVGEGAKPSWKMSTLSFCCSASSYARAPSSGSSPSPSSRAPRAARAPSEMAAYCSALSQAVPRRLRVRPAVLHATVVVRPPLQLEVGVLVRPAVVVLQVRVVMRVRSWKMVCFWPNSRRPRVSAST